LRGKFHPEILTSFLSQGVKQGMGEENKPFFRFKRQYLEKTVGDTANVTIRLND